VLRAVGLLDLLAWIAIIAPATQIAAMHARLGMGPFPEAPIAMYLTRTASLLYGFCGLLLLFLSRDVVRYSPVIRFLAYAGVCASLLLLSIDITTGMPLWWAIFESSACAGLWALVAWCEARSRAGL